MPDRAARATSAAPPDDPADDGIDPGAPGPGGPDAPDVEALRRQLADAPAEVVVANHCYGLFELAAVYLSSAPPRLESGRLAIDALGALIEGLAGRLGDAEAELREALAQIRLAFVQIASVGSGGPDGATPTDPQAGSDTGA